MPTRLKTQRKCPNVVVNLLVSHPAGASREYHDERMTSQTHKPHYQSGDANRCLQAPSRQIGVNDLLEGQRGLGMHFRGGCVTQTMKILQAAH